MVYREVAPNVAEFVLAGPPAPYPPLGAQPGCRRTEIDLALPAGGLLLLYTDGLIERREEDLDTGLTRLRDTASPDHPELVCRTVMHQLVGSDSPIDDIAILAMRREPPADQPPAP